MFYFFFLLFVLLTRVDVDVQLQSNFLMPFSVMHSFRIDFDTNLFTFIHTTDEIVNTAFSTYRFSYVYEQFCVSFSGIWIKANRNSRNCCVAGRSINLCSVRDNRLACDAQAKLSYSHAVLVFVQNKIYLKQHTLNTFNGDSTNGGH